MAGTSNFSSRKQNEIVQFVENDSSLRVIESKYQCIGVKDIQQETDFSACIVKGVVTKVYPSVQTTRGWTMKFSIKDFGAYNRPDPCNDSGDGRNVISVFLKGSLVEKHNILKEKDVLVITGAQVEKSSREGHEFNIIANESKDLKMWVIRDPENKTSDITSLASEKLVESNTKAAEKKVYGTGNSYMYNEPPNKRCRLVLQPKAETYTKLANLTVNTVVNVYGVVKFFKSPFKTKGSDFVCTMSLVDPSFDSLDQSFNCVLFSKSKASLPLIKSVGDVVRIHRLGVREFRGDRQGKFMTDSSWIVFDINSMDTPQVRASSSKSYILTDIDKDILNELKLWATHKETLNKQFTFTRLQDLNTNQNFINLLCQVVSKCYTESGGVALTLWDGSLPACQSILVEPISKQQQVTSDELMCKAAKRCVEVFLYDDHTMGNVQRVHPGDFVCIRNVHIKEVESNSSVTAEKSAQSHPVVSLEVHKGTICGRGVEILSAGDPVVTSTAMLKFMAEAKALEIQQSEVSESAKLEKNKRPAPPSRVCEGTHEKKDDFKKEIHQNSTVVREESRALQTSCTVTEHPCVPFTSLKDIRACTTVPNKFRCRVKARMYLPSDVKSFVRRSCLSCRYLFAEHSDTNPSEGVNSCVSSHSVVCPRCNLETSLVYLFSFVIEDESGLLHAMVFDRDVATFFPDLPSPHEFLQQAHLHETVGEWMSSMTHNPDNSIEFVNQDTKCDKRPWLELCILSYFPQGNGDSRKVLYRVFDSTFVADTRISDELCLNLLI